MVMAGSSLVMPSAGPALIMPSAGPPVVHSMHFCAAGMFNLPPMGDARIVEFHPFRADLMVSQEADAVMADPVKHPPERRTEPQIIMRPEMVEGNEDIRVGTKTEVRIHSQTAIPHKANSGNESGAGRQWRPAAIAFAFSLAPANPARAPSVSGHPSPAETRIPHPAAIMKYIFAP